MRFIIELLFAELIFLYPADKRKKFTLRAWTIILLCVLGLVIFPDTEMEGKSVIVQLIAFLGLFLLTVAAMGVCFELTLSSLFSLCVAGYAVEHIAFHVNKIAEKILALSDMVVRIGDRGGLTVPIKTEFIVFPPVYLIAFISLGLFSARNECWKKSDMRFNLLSIAMVSICVGLTRVVIAFDGDNSIPVSIYAITSCVMALVVQFVLYRTVDLQSENTAVNLMWQEERKQYELSKKTIDTINIKYHDLKHKLRDMNLPTEEIESIKEAVRIYGSRIRTGNDVLDVLLTENSLRCSEEGISLTYTGNGADFGFMQTMDIYSLFGNAVSNAVEATEKLDDPEKKIIDIVSERMGDMVNIRICNFYKGNIEMKDGIPLTSKKEEEGFHGYGMKSMELIAKKYGGGISASVEDDLFILNVYLIRPLHNPL